VDPLSWLWVFFVLASLQPALTRQLLVAQRRRALAVLSRQRQATVPALERQLMSLYPQPRGRTPAVEYVPGPRAPALPPGQEVPPRRTDR
jgi:hypothetical protein